MTSPVEGAFAELLAALTHSAAFVTAHPFYADTENRAAGFAFLVSMLLARLEEDVIFDADYPYFRVLDSRIREGGDNPDQRYLIASLRGGQAYRVWGNLGTARRLDFQVYSGNPYVPGSGGRAASFLTFEQMTFRPDGAFEVLVAPSRHEGNWVENPTDGTRILVRQIFSDWPRERPGEIHIDRLGHEGSLKPPLTEDALASRLRKAAGQLTTHVRVWPEMVRTNYLDTLPPNQLSAPFDPGRLGGVPGRWMSHGIFELSDDEALIVRTWPANGNYQGIQLADVWFSSLEYANRQTSLTADQAHQSGDGSYFFVVSSQDPGVANWLDTVGHHRGVILLRYDGTTGGFDPANMPTTAVVKRSALPDHLPSDTPLVSPEQRLDAIAARRRHVQIRFGN